MNANTNFTSTSWLPTQGSHYASDVDFMVVLMILLCGTVLFAILVTIIIFAIKYRRREVARIEMAKDQNLRLEITWTVVPLIIFVGIFSLSVTTYLKAELPPSNAQEILVVGKQWMWKFQHPEGPRELNELHVALGTPIRLLMISQDAIHSLYLPEFRIKQDVLPGRYTQLWFTPEHVGTFHVRCAEYCGTDHSRMNAQVIVMEPAEYAIWLDRNGTHPSLAAKGGRLFESYGCTSCHNGDNIDKAPTLWDDFGSTITLEGGETLKVDEDYLRESILDPAAKKQVGYRAIMPIYAERLSEEDVLSLIAYIKSLHGTPSHTLRGAQP